uniref:Electron transfer flavoprotein subunit beta n=1 Tax=Geobacter metallireducens TaxID=28232 RepID=A0A831U1E9_GEOME
MITVACVKQVPDTTQVQIDPVTNTLVREGIPFIVNPYDTHALEESLRMKDRFGFRAVALSMGPPNAEAALRRALCLGADDAILCSDRCFGGAGGGRMWREEQLGSRINHSRVDEALRAAPDTICVTCPYCMTMLEDGLKDRQAGETRVRDIAEVVAEGLRFS